MDSRKDLYLEKALMTKTYSSTLFEDVYIEHNSLPNLNFEDIDTSVYFLDKKMSFPLIIPGMTGGTNNSLEINKILYDLSLEFNIGFSTGSMDHELDSENLSKLFIQKNKLKKSGNIVLSNLDARASIEKVEKSIEILNADGISLYLNTSQDMISDDGNKNFQGVLKNIENIVKIYGEKVLIKEKSLGMSTETIKKLVDAGVRYIDVSGSGGSNMIEIENHRNYQNDFSDLFNWGIPTAKSILNAKYLNGDFKIIASGGIKTSQDIIKSIILGADYVSIGGEILKYALMGGYNQAKIYLEDIIHKTKIIMLFLGVKNIDELKRVKYKLTGRLKDLE